VYTAAMVYPEDRTTEWPEPTVQMRVFCTRPVAENRKPHRSARLIILTAAALFIGAVFSLRSAILNSLPATPQAVTGRSERVAPTSIPIGAEPVFRVSAAPTPQQPMGIADQVRLYRRYQQMYAPPAAPIWADPAPATAGPLPRPYPQQPHPQSGSVQPLGALVNRAGL
jgi:hypothetical protein